jgi:Zn-dependent peptidase ImmA (M78 family)
VSKFKAEPLSNAIICAITKDIRKALGIRSNSPINIVAVLEMAMPQLVDDFNYSIREEKDMSVKNVHAYTDHENNEIVIREDIYEFALEGRGRDRFTIAHEIGHFLLHNNKFMALRRTYSGEEVKTYEDPEWQADAFAGEFLCPAAATKGMNIERIAEKFGVSLDSAKIQKRKGENTSRNSG